MLHMSDEREASAHWRLHEFTHITKHPSSHNRANTHSVQRLFECDAPPPFFVRVTLRAEGGPQLGAMPPIVYYQSEAHEAAEEAAGSIEQE